MKKGYTITPLIIIILLVGCNNTTQPKFEKEQIKIGFIGPLTGPVANPGIYVKNSFELARSQHSSVDGKEVKVFYEDGKCLPKEGVNAARKLLDVDEVNIIVSAICGGSMLAIAPITQDKILISPVSSTPAISNAGENVFRISSSANLFADKTAIKIRELGYERLGLVVENTEYAIGWKNAFIKNFGETIVGIETFNAEDTNIKTQLMKIDDKKPDAILLLVQSPLSATLLVKQAKELNIKTQLIGNEAFFTRQVVKALMGDAAEGLLVLTYKYNIKSEKMQNFITNYERAYGEEIPEEIYGALGYDTYLVLHDSLKHCKEPEAGCMREYLYQIRNREGVSGLFSIDKKGDAIRDFMWWKVKGGTLTPLVG